MTVGVFNVILAAVVAAAGAFAFSRRRVASALFVVLVWGLYAGLPPVGFAVVGTLMLLMTVSAPLYITIGALTVVCFFFGAEEYQQFSDYQILIEKIFTLTDKNVLLAIPFFVVAGSLMTAGGMARRVISFADAVVGWLPGGLAAATVLSCAFFAAISGSSPVTVIAIGSIMMPALVKHGYPKAFSMGLVTSAGSLGILVPPSIPMIIYAIVVTGPMSVDVADLFIAGLVPGLLIAGALIAYSVYIGTKQPDFRWRDLRPPSLLLIAKRFRESFWALLLPVIVLGGIYPIFGPTGFFTPTEAAAVSAVYALLVEVFVHRELDLGKIPALLVESAVMMGALLIIMILSFSLNHYFVDQQLPDRAVAWIQSLDLDRTTFLIALNVLLLFVGCLMDIISAVLVVAPLLAPIAHSFGIDPVHLAIIFVVNLEIGYLTPPIGINLFVSATLFRVPIGFVTRAVLPFTLVMLGCLAAITWYQPLATGLGETLSPDVTETVEIAEDSNSEEGAPAEDSAEVLSIEDLMRQADDDDDDDDDDDVEEEPLDRRVRSIEELMNEANDGSGEGD